MRKGKRLPLEPSVLVHQIVPAILSEHQQIRHLILESLPGYLVEVEEGFLVEEEGFLAEEVEGFLEESFLAEEVEGFHVEEEGFLVELGPGCWRVLCVRQIVMLSYGTSEVFSGGDSSGARYVGSSRGSPEMNFGDSPSDGSERSSVGSLDAWEVTKGDSVYRNFLHRSFPNRLASSSLHILPVVSPR